MYQEASSAQLQFRGAQVLAAAFMDVFPHAKILNASLGSFSFVYEFALDSAPESSFLPVIEDAFRKVLKEGQEPELLEFIAHNAIDFFKHHGQTLRARSIQKDDTFVEVYRQGSAIDFCFYKEKKRFVDTSDTKVSTQELGAFQLLSLEKQHKKSLGSICRIKGVAAADKTSLKDYLKKSRELEKFAHKELAQKLGLYQFLQANSSVPFYSEKGLQLAKNLQKLWKSFFPNYQQVQVPNFFHLEAFSDIKNLKSQNSAPLRLKKNQDNYSSSSSLAGLFLFSQNKKQSPKRLFEIETEKNHEKSYQALAVVKPENLLDELLQTIESYRDFYKSMGLEVFLCLPSRLPKNTLESLSNKLQEIGLPTKTLEKKAKAFEFFFLDRYERLVFAAKIEIFQNFLDKQDLFLHSPFPSQFEFIRELLEHFQGHLPKILSYSILNSN